MDEVYLEIYSTADECLAPIETIVTLFTIKYCDSKINIKLVRSKQKLDERAYTIDISNFTYEIIEIDEVPYYASLCELPNISINKTSCIAGLCTILRQIIKDTATQCPSHYCRKLLGFKDSCLLTCSEASVWTKFCEIDLILTLKFLNARDIEHNELPITLARFEHHMSQPVRLHNLYKYTMSKKCADEKIIMQEKSRMPEHVYAEGFYMTLADVIIFVTELHPSPCCKRKLVQERSKEVIQGLELKIELESVPLGAEEGVDWSSIPFDATPEGGALPPARLKKKQQQLENLCKPVMKLAKPGDTIVDFCSGSGHLGILVAHLLPHCTVILVENKEESLNRAKARVKKLQLGNIKFCQCNLDYFKGDFDIGMSLHACGVATDLVIRQCIEKNAVFVSCPCCYGSLHDCHHLTYPRSDVFKNKIDMPKYTILSHAADQTHDEHNVKTKQGYECMAIVDTDRKLQAEQYGYEVHLCKLAPSTCTPKNHLLVGIPKVKCANEE
ncbi:hypothetical protein KM043_005599 [Ampulex compressa]|nr:hypothetical protein KM043_005599 [Ampulex compressa]